EGCGAHPCLRGCAGWGRNDSTTGTKLRRTQARSLRQERQRLQLRDLEGLAAADVDAGQLVVAAHHIRLRLGESAPVPLIGVARQLRPFPPHHPGHLVLARLPALGAGEGMRPLFRRLVEKISLFHRSPAPGLFRSGGIYSILILAMTKRKPARFSATKAVKAN